MTDGGARSVVVVSQAGKPPVTYTGPLLQQRKNSIQSELLHTARVEFLRQITITTAYTY